MSKFNKSIESATIGESMPDRPQPDQSKRAIVFPQKGIKDYMPSRGQLEYFMRFGEIPVEQAKSLNLLPQDFTYENANWVEIDKVLIEKAKEYEKTNANK